MREYIHLKGKVLKFKCHCHGEHFFAVVADIDIDKGITIKAHLSEDDDLYDALCLNKESVLMNDGCDLNYYFQCFWHTVEKIESGNVNYTETDYKLKGSPPNQHTAFTASCAFE